jgi:hypothetical protein
VEVACFTTAKKHDFGTANERQQQVFLHLLADTGATIFVIFNPVLRAQMVNIKPKPRVPHHILMNAHPEPIVDRGSITLPIVCSRTGTTHFLFVEDCVYVPTSRHNILSWSAHADACFAKTKVEPWMRVSRDEVVMPTADGGEVWGKRVGIRSACA